MCSVSPRARPCHRWDSDLFFPTDQCRKALSNHHPLFPFLLSWSLTTNSWCGQQQETPQRPAGMPPLHTCERQGPGELRRGSVDKKQLLKWSFILQTVAWGGGTRRIVPHTRGTETAYLGHPKNSASSQSGMKAEIFPGYFSKIP